MSFYSNNLYGQRLKHRASSVDENQQPTKPAQSQLPCIVTPTFGDWKLEQLQSVRQDSDVAHPKISRKNPLYDKFGLNEIQRRTPISSLNESSVNDPTSFQTAKKYSVSPIRDLRSEGQVQREQLKSNQFDLVSEGKRYNSTGKNGRRSRNEDIPYQEHEDFKSADRIHWQNSDEEQKPQAYQIPNLNKFIKVPKRVLKFNQNTHNSNVTPTNQSPTSLKFNQNPLLKMGPQLAFFQKQRQAYSLQESPTETISVGQVKTLEQYKQRNGNNKQKLEQLRQQLVTIDEENTRKAEIVFLQCCALLDQQKAFYENVLKNNSLFYKYSKINKKELTKQKTKLRENYENIYLK